MPKNFKPFSFEMVKNFQALFVRKWLNKKVNNFPNPYNPPSVPFLKKTKKF